MAILLKCGIIFGMHDGNYISVNKLQYSYQEDDQNRLALDGVDLHIKKGEFLAIVGHNGSGKSTLALCLNALLTPFEGEVIVDGLNTKDEENVWEIRKRVGMVFQNPDNQLVSSIIEDDVAFGPENIGVDPAEIRTRVDDALRAVNMLDYAKKSPHLLSGGQKQRVAIAGVIAMQTPCIVFDESTAMLDPKGRNEILDIIRKLHDDGHTIVMITHFMDEAAFADRIIVMDDGKTVFEGSPKELFKDSDEIKKYGLEMPFTVQLCEELRVKGMTIPDDITDQDELVDYLCGLN